MIRNEVLQPKESTLVDEVEALKRGMQGPISPDNMHREHDPSDGVKAKDQIERARDPRLRGKDVDPNSNRHMPEQGR